MYNKYQKISLKCAQANYYFNVPRTDVQNRKRARDIEKTNVF